MAVETTIGARVAEVRGQLSQTVFSTKIGVHKNTVGRIERGEYTPDGEFLQALYREFGISPTWVLTGLGPKGISPGIAVGLLMVDALQKGKPFSAEDQRERLGVDDDTFCAYLSGAKLATPDFLARFADLTGYPLSRLIAARDLCTAMVATEAVAAGIAPEVSNEKPAPVAKINVDALEAVIEGSFIAAPKMPPGQRAALCASLYHGLIDRGEITPEGIGTGNSSNAA